MFLFWVVNRSRPLHYTAFLKVEYLAQFSSSHTRNLYLLPLKDTMSYTICLPLTRSRTVQLLAPALILSSASCKIVSDIKKWTTYNNLQLNEDKTEALLFDPTKTLGVLKLRKYDIHFYNSARNLCHIGQSAYHEATG